MKSSYKRLGHYIRRCDEINEGMQIDLLLGINNAKYFVKAKTNTNGIDLQKYRIVRNRQFAFNRATTRNGDKISIALRDGDDCIVSPSYRVFEVKDENILSSEYLMMWFRRPEFDRYARYKSHGSAHEFFDWQEMCEVTLPVPHIDEQREIVKEYYTIVNRIKLNEQLSQKLEETAQAIYRQWFVDFEFPDENGQPYKSSGGEMEYNIELDRKIPKGWTVQYTKDYGTVITGKTPSSSSPEYFGNIMLFVTPTDFKRYGKFVVGAERGLSDKGIKSLSKKVLDKNSLLITCIGSDMGKVAINPEPCVTNQQLNSIVPHHKYVTEFLNYYFKSIYSDLRNMATGSSTMLMINKSDFELIRVIKPDDKVLRMFSSLLNPISSKIWSIARLSKLLIDTKSVLLASLANKEKEIA